MKPAARYLGLLPLLVLAIGLLATWAGWRVVDRAVEDRAALRFDQEVAQTAASIAERLRTYELMLRGGAGLFFASDHVSRGEFRTYLKILQVQEDYPGIQGFGFAEAIGPSALAGHEARIRAEGFPGYAVHPAGDRSFYTAIVFLEPWDERNRTAFGFDMFATPVRRAAMIRARDSGEAAISGIVRMVQEIDDDTEPGFLMYLPVYIGGSDPGSEEARRATLTGFVFAPFRVAELMQGLLPDGASPLTISLYDGTEPDAAQLLHRDGTVAAGGSRYHARVALQVPGRRWTAVFDATPQFVTRTHAGSEAATVAGAGLAVSLVLFVIAILATRMVSERRHSAQAIRATERKLHQAQKMESIGQLTGGIAHDFNNLLTVVMGNAESLTERLDGDERSQRLAEMIVRAAQRGADLTQRLLAIARRQALAPRVTDIAAQLATMEGLLRRSLGAAVEVGIATPGELWPALVDPAQLESALLNLCINARDAMPNGGRLTIGMSNRTIDRQRGGGDGGPEAELSPGAYVVITVSDTGIGMNADTLARAFDPFFTTKGIGEGSGLGLSMVYGFAKQSNGHATIASSPGAGTRVTLYLPKAEGAPVAGEERPAGRRFPRGTERILLVEDDALVRGNAAAQLQALGYDVIAAANAQAALDALDRIEGLDLLFTDIVMPGGMDGWQLAAEVQRRRPDLPVLYTSGHMQDIQPFQAAGAGPVQVLQKPYRRADLAQRVRQALDGA